MTCHYVLPFLVIWLWLCGCVSGTAPLIMSSSRLSKLPSYDELLSISHSHSGSISSSLNLNNLTVSESCQISLSGRNLSHPKQLLMAAYSGHAFDDLGNFDACQQLSISHHCSAQFTIFNISVIMGLCIPKNCTQEDMLVGMPVLIDGPLGILYNTLSLLNIINSSTLLTSCASQEITWENDTNAVVIVSIGLTMVILVGLATIADHLFSIHDYDNELHHHHDLHDHTWNYMATSTHAALADLTHSLHPHHHHGDDTCVYTHLQSDDFFRMEQQHQPPTIPSSWRQLITSFSAIHNIRKLITPMPKSNVDMSCLNGIRVLSLIWVIMGHTIYYELPLERDPLYVVTGVVPRISFQAVMDAFFAVDSFFFLSGFLGAYYLLPQLLITSSHKFPKLLSGYYFHRYVRITPIYIWWLMWDWKVSRFMGAGQSPLHFLVSGGIQLSGSVQNNSTGIEHVSPDNPCDNYWWANLLYINNFIPSSHSDQCFPWSWYLANDMQFAIILPFLIYLYSRYRLTGILTLLSILITSFTYVGIISDIQGYSASMLDNNNIYGYYDDIYGKPYGRIQPFIMGILFALLLHVHPHRIPNRIYRPCMLIAAFLMAGIIFGPAQLYHSLNTDHILNEDDISTLTRDQWSRLTHDLYMATSRGMWGLGLGFFCYSMIVGTGEDIELDENSKIKEPGSYVRTFLSHPIWTPFARLSYQAYLIHEIWINYYVHQLRQKPYYSDWSYTVQVIAHVVMAFVWATIGYILIEKPIMNLSNWLLNTLSGKKQTPREDESRQE